MIAGLVEKSSGVADDAQKGRIAHGATCGRGCIMTNGKDVERVRAAKSGNQGRVGDAGSL